MILLGIPVRRGGRGVTLISIILSSLMLLFTLLSIVAPLLTGGGMPDVIASACVSVLPMVLLTLLLVWLIQGYKGSGALDAMQAQYNQQYWQYAQQQQMYGQGPYGVPPPAQQPLPPRPIVDTRPPPSGEGHEPPKAP
jgi:hypothetical protein